MIGALVNGCVVLSEDSLGVDPLMPGEHFACASYDDLPGALAELLDDPARLDEMRHAAYDLVRDRMPMSAAWDELADVPGRRELPRRDRDAAAGGGTPPAPGSGCARDPL